MRNLFYSLIGVVLLYTNCTSQNTLDTAWVNSYGGKGIDIGRDIKQTSDRGFIILGTTTTYGSGLSSFYLIKTDSLGKHQWSQSIGTENNDNASSIEIASDGGFFLCGSTDFDFAKGYDGYVIKTDFQGKVQWSKNYGGNDWDFIYNSCLMPDGGLILCGESYSQSSGGSDGFLVRIDKNGDTLWTKNIGGTGNDAFYSVEYKNGRIYVVGKFFNSTIKKNTASLYKLDLSGSIIKNEFYQSDTSEHHTNFDLAITANCDILLCGQRNNGPDNHYFLRKVDTTNFLQLNSIQNNSIFYARTVLEGNNGDVYILGPKVGGQGLQSAYFVRFDPNFIFFNNALFGGAKDDEGYEMIRTDKGYAIVGSTKSYGNGGEDGEENVYLVVFNKADLVNEYFLMITEFQDNLSPVGVKENIYRDNKSLVYPNPANDFFKIELPNSNNEVFDISISNNIGEVVFFENKRAYNNTLTYEGLQIPKGTYLFRVSSHAKIVCSGLIVFR